jgi:hypothetical protein
VVEGERGHGEKVVTVSDGVKVRTRSVIGFE